MAIKSYTELEVFCLSYRLAMEVFRLCKKFPKEEKYSLCTQVINSSRSIPTNIAEGWSKRNYQNVFKRHLMDAIGSLEETKVWLNFALDCEYISKDDHKIRCDNCDEIGKKLIRLHTNWKTF